MKTKKISLAILSLIIVLTSSMVTVLGQVTDYGALEDPYDNANYVQVFNDTRLNTTYGATELNYSGGASVKVYELFITDFTEADPLGRISIPNEYHIDFTLERDTQNTLVYNDTGAQTLHEWEHDIDFNTTSMSDNMGKVARCMIFCYTTFPASRKDIVTGLHEEIGMRVGQNSTAPITVSLQLEELTDGVSFKGNRTNFDYQEMLYLTMNKNGTEVKVQVWNDKARTSLNVTLTHTLQNNQTYRYIVPLQSNEANAAANDEIVGDLDDMWFGHMSAGPSYDSSGNYYTTDLMTGLKGEAVALQTNCTLGGGVITIEYSDDNSTWQGTETLTAGQKSWEMRDMGFNASCYLRVNFTLGADSPRLFDIVLITNEGQAAVSDTSWFLPVGIIISGSVCFLLMVGKKID